MCTESRSSSSLSSSRLLSSSRQFEHDFVSQYVPINEYFGPLHVTYTRGIREQIRRPIIVTMNDVGYNYYHSDLAPFFAHPTMHDWIRHFSLLHIDAPGQESFAPTFRSDPPQQDETQQQQKKKKQKQKSFIGNNYPTLDEIASGVAQVLRHFAIPTDDDDQRKDEDGDNDVSRNDKDCRHTAGFVGFGIGIGANILCRLACRYPDTLNGLFLIDTAFGPPNWLESITERLLIAATLRLQNAKPNRAIRIMRKLLLRNYFAQTKSSSKSSNNDDHNSCDRSKRAHYRQPDFNEHNFALFLRSSLERTELRLRRRHQWNQWNQSNQSNNDDDEDKLKCPILLIVGRRSARFDESRRMAARLSPINCSLWCIDGVGADVMRRKSNEIADALKLFLQGIGYVCRGDGAGRRKAAGIGGEGGRKAHHLKHAKMMMRTAAKEEASNVCISTR